MNKGRLQEGKHWNLKSILSGCILSITLWIISVVVLSGQIVDYRLTISKCNTILAVLNIPILLLGIVFAMQKMKPIIASVSISCGYIMIQWFFAVVILGGKMQQADKTIISILISNAAAAIIIYQRRNKKNKHKNVYR